MSAVAGAPPSTIKCPFLSPPASCVCLWWMGFQASGSLGPPAPICKSMAWGGRGSGSPEASQAGVDTVPLEQTSVLQLRPFPFCISPRFGGSPAFSRPGGLSGPHLQAAGLAWPVGGNVLLGSVCVGCWVVLNGSDTRLGDWWPRNTLSPPGPGGLWSSSRWEVKRLFALLKCLGISSV